MRKLSKSRRAAPKASRPVHVGTVRLTGSGERGAFRVVVHDRAKFRALVRAFRRGDLEIAGLSLVR